MERKNIDKMTGDLLKKGIQNPNSQDFNDELMKKITSLPKPEVIKTSNRFLKNGWRFLILALSLLLVSIAIVSYLATGFDPEISKVFEAAKMYILYGGMALFVPLLFSQFDELLKLMFENHMKPRLDY